LVRCVSAGNGQTRCSASRPPCGGHGPF
jgi:hypothetical protein